MHDRLILIVTTIVVLEILVVAAALRAGRTVAKRRSFNEHLTQVPDLIDTYKN